MTVSKLGNVLILVLVGLLAAITTTIAIGAPAVTVTSERTVYIYGPIYDGNILDLGERLVQWSKEDPSAPVTIVINSPGGEVYTGYIFYKYLDALHARGTHIRCVVKDMAASMAFQILTHCNSRYALSKSLLLWHRVRISGSLTITAPLADTLRREMDLMDQRIYKEVVGAFPEVPDSVLSYHFEKETLHTAEDIRDHIDPDFLTVLPHIPGLIDIEDLDLPTSSSSPFGEEQMDGIYHSTPELLRTWGQAHGR